MEEFYESLANHFDETLIASLKEVSENGRTHCLLLNESKMKREDFLALFPLVKPHPIIPNAFLYDKADYDFGKSILFAAGAIYIQDASAMLPAYFLNPNPGDACIDLCAAPGGKTIDAALLMKGEGAIVTNDYSFPRAKELSSNIERMGIADAIVTSSSTKELASFYGEAFDKVILDAPCSGSAMFRKNDLAKSDWTREKVLSCAKLQKDLLEEAYRLLAKGGRMVYSTCSFSKEENEDNVASFLSLHPDMKLVELPSHPSFFHPAQAKEAIYIFPFSFPGEGQFLAVMEKTGERQMKTYEEKGKAIAEAVRFAKTLGIEGGCFKEMRESYYRFPFFFPISEKNTLRFGLKIAEKAKTLIPDHAISHALPSASSLSLTLEQANHYLRGETFLLDAIDGFHIVSYNGMNLGFVKVIKGNAKNHYPKGLRIPLNASLKY